MVNGNYILYGDRPSSESEIVDDHVQTKTTDRKLVRKNNRSANDLHRSLNMAQLDNETDSIKYEKKIKEPKLLRYVPTKDAEIDSSVTTDKIKTDRYTYEPRKYAYTKKSKNPTDGSGHYTYSRSSSSCSSPGGNLPTIAENVEHYTPFRTRGPPSPSLGYLDYESKLEKYFTKPRDAKMFPFKVGYNGSHPDSLYRVSATSAINQSRVVKIMRLLRWPAALLIICVALAVFVYFLMPDSFDVDTDTVNATYWEANAVGSHSIHANHVTDTQAKSTTERSIGNEKNKSRTHGTKTSEIDFYDVSYKDVQSIKDLPISTKPERKLPAPPVFPAHISPEVQYGNERADLDAGRNSKSINNSVQKETTSKPHITQKPEKPISVYFKDIDDITTTESAQYVDSSQKQETRNSRKTLVTYPRTSSYLTLNVNNEQHIDVQKLIPNSKNFTSGHSKFFGISIEDAENYKPTTQSALYNTKVSPTLPVWRHEATTKYPVTFTEGLPQCRSTRLELCRGVLPYDLTMPTPIPLGIDSETLLTQIEFLVSSNCSYRTKQFLCAVLEPECSPPPNPTRMPCYNLCKTVLDNCEGLIPREISSLFNCKQYPETKCSTSRAPCFPRETSCGDGSCIPREWTCDGKVDCPSGIDESRCAACKENEFRCKTGGCIQKRWRCDGYTDCPGGEDEESCEKTVQSGDLGEEISGSSLAISIRKPNSQQKITLEDKYHKSKVQTESESTELLMTSDSNNGLKRNFTRRPLPTRLVPYTRISSRVTTESQTNNEAPQTTEPASRYSGDIYSAHMSPCPPGDLRCVDGRCITLSQLCDGTVDCSDNSDENNCFT